jgi:hypothetical protein
MELSSSRQAILSLVESMLDQAILTPSDLRRYVTSAENQFDPEFVRQDLEEWYRNLGIESIIGRKFSISPCPFSRAEIAEAHQNHQTILCVPQNVTRSELGELFRMDNWALHDQLVTPATEKKDCWFKTSMDLRPIHLNKTGMEIKHLFADEGKLHFSLERYLVFIARIKHLTCQTPDQEYWIWLPRKAYDRSGMLIAGFDRYGSFNVHGWMPQFSASFVGARYGLLPSSADGSEGG